MKEDTTPKTLLTSLGLASVLSLGSVGVMTQSVEAAIINGSFESGLVGWMDTGVVSVEDGSFGVIPTDGNNQGLGTTADGATATNTDLEDFLGVPVGVFDDPGDLFFGIATEGSALKQTFTAQAGDTVTLDWNFLTSDMFNPDYAFVILSLESDLMSLTFNDLFRLDSSDGLIGSSSSFDDETGYVSFSESIPTDGTYLLAIGVVDSGNDVSGDSGVLVDNIILNQQSNSIPEHSSVFSLGLLGLWLLLRKGSSHQ